MPQARTDRARDPHHQRSMRGLIVQEVLQHQHGGDLVTRALRASGSKAEG